MTDQTKPDVADSLEAHLIADYVSEGMPLVDACRSVGVGYRTAYDWIARSPRFAEMMDAARETGFDAIAANVRRVARGEEGYSTGDVKRDKLVVETDVKLLSKWHPKKYGDKLQVEQKTATVTIPVADDPIAAQRAYEQLMRGGDD